MIDLTQGKIENKQQITNRAEINKCIKTDPSIK